MNPLPSMKHEVLFSVRNNEKVFIIKCCMLQGFSEWVHIQRKHLYHFLCCLSLKWRGGGSTFKGKTLLLLRSKSLPLGIGLIGGSVYLSVCGPRKQTGSHNTCLRGKMAEKHVNNGLHHNVEN